MFHKSAHIFGSSMLQVQHGMCTWSASCAYQAAYFAAKAIVSMLGATIVEPHSIGTGLLDVWHTPDNTKRRDPEPVVRVYRCPGGDTSHPQTWAFLQQALRKTANVSDFCDQQLKLAILDVEPTDFARKRNDLHYRNTEWSGDDLHACMEKEQFGRFTGWALDHERDDFLLLLCFSLIHVGQTMLSQLAQSSKVIEAEKSLVDVWLSQPFARLYQDNLASIVPQPAAI